MPADKSQLSQQIDNSTLFNNTSCSFQECDRNWGHRFCIMVCPKYLIVHCLLILQTHYKELMNQWVVMATCHCYFLWWRRPCVWHFVSKWLSLSPTVMPAFIVVILPSNCFCGNFSAISYIASKRHGPPDAYAHCHCPMYALPYLPTIGFAIIDRVQMTLLFCHTCCRVGTSMKGKSRNLAIYLHERKNRN